jgi:hypothetical protein
VAAADEQVVGHRHAGRVRSDLDAAALDVKAGDSETGAGQPGPGDPRLAGVLRLHQHTRRGLARVQREARIAAVAEANLVTRLSRLNRRLSSPDAGHDPVADRRRPGAARHGEEDDGEGQNSHGKQAKRDARHLIPLPPLVAQAA